MAGRSIACCVLCCEVVVLVAVSAAMSLSLRQEVVLRGSQALLRPRLRAASFS